MNFKEWLTSEHHRMATEYRLALEREVNATKRIFGTITPDVKEMMVKALKGIPVPTMDKWQGDREGTMQIYNETPKPDFSEILNEFINS